MSKSSILFLLLTTITIACNSKSNKKISSGNDQNRTIRYGMVTGIKPDKIEYYKKLHADPWREVMKKIKECNIKNYSIYLKKIEGNYFLFSYFEYTGNDFSADMKKMAADTTTQRWWRETDPCQQPLPDAAEKGQKWSEMEEVFHYE